MQFRFVLRHPPGKQFVTDSLAEAVLAESEDRTLDRTGTAREHRQSEDTVEP